MIACEQCGLVFEPKNSVQRFCGNSCRYQSHGATIKRIAQRKALRQKRLAFIRRVKLHFGCSECGYKLHSAALQFDHINPEEKSFTIGGAHTRSLDQIKSEMRKCRILCANCHSVHTYNQIQEKYHGLSEGL